MLGGCYIAIIIMMILMGGTIKVTPTSTIEGGSGLGEVLLVGIRIDGAVLRAGFEHAAFATLLSTRH